MEFPLTNIEARILGSLMEKQMTTPDLYPLSVNTLKNACNQKSSREPVVSYDEPLIEKTLIALRNRELIYTVTGSGSRVRKYEQRLSEKLFLNARENAVICLLLLRGPQTIGELKTRSERMYKFDSLEQVMETLEELAAETRRPMILVTQLQRIAGQKEPRFAHLICGTPQHPVADKPQEASAANGDEQNAESNHPLEERLAALEDRLLQLEQKLQKFVSQFE